MKHLYLRCIAGIGLLCACTKTETVPYEAAATNLMLEYKIVNVQGDPIYGAIQHNDTTISLYLPFYRQLATLEPQIKVSAGATVTPATGTMIEDLPAVFQNGRDIKYTVKNTAGNARVYTLHIIAQQPDMELQELTTDPANPAEYTLDMNGIYSSIGINLYGKGFASSNDMMKIVLVNEQGKETAPVYFSSTNTNDLTMVGFSISRYQDQQDPIVKDLAATGLYKVRLYNYAKVITMKNPVRINVLNKK
ncbi:hypothetical protein [Chitinophaga sp. Cy-1792]|uniref:hypothetical protein n=1 Tax=Chitinophaga sp. Cy-1792 TaxID=2608339 RepID=UPI00141DFC77|nr:hypothetical protein [Chitinophaga sp. Cy-1792]NIG56392.1 hypothetical protein [Chitinophaga sp. Cy-1792]